MDRNAIIGLSLMFLLFLVWQWVVGPTAEEQAAQQRLQDSLARVQQQQTLNDSLSQDSLTTIQPDTGVVDIEQPDDSLQQLKLSGAFGPFAEAAAGQEQTYELENDLFRITFTNKGGRIKQVLLKKHHKLVLNEEKKEVKKPLYLLEDEKNKFEYLLPVAGLPSGGVLTGDLYFTAELTDNQIVFRAPAGEGRFFEQRYEIKPGVYDIDYDLRLVGLNNIISAEADQFRLNWLNYPDKIEINTRYERTYSTIHYKEIDETPSYCSYTSNDEEEIAPVRWVSHSNQFFNAAIIAEDQFKQAVMETESLEEDAEDLKIYRTTLAIPYQRKADETFAMRLYIGPNEFDRLRAMGYYLEDVIPFGWSVFGTINRWVIRPLFNFLSGFIGSKGIVILILTFIVKLLLYPLTYRMLYSQSKMSALKPQLEGMREKHKEDPQKQQMEQMKVYREFGVNPLGGCLPMLLQMPIWFALYRFFPASIEFRQAGFLWATDLSSYDAFVRLPFEIPLGFGSHLSLFTLLWAVTTLIYTYYNTRHMDMSANPAMKYMQYLMPLFFLGFFNSFASGLTCYLLFSNLMNITQTIVTKNYIIDQDKIMREMEAYRKKPKKKGGFRDRLEKALKEQQRVQAEKEAQQKKKKTKR